MNQMIVSDKIYKKKVNVGYRTRANYFTDYSNVDEASFFGTGRFFLYELKICNKKILGFQKIS